MKLPLLLTLVLFFVCPLALSAERLEVVVAVEANWAPMEFVDENGDIVGFSVDYVSAVAREAGFDTTYVNIPWEGIFTGLLNNDYDMVASSVSITPEREKLMDFSIPYYDVHQAFITHAESAVRRQADLAGKRIGVQVGTTGHFASEKITGLEIAAFSEIGQALQALEKGELDGVFADDPIATGYILNNRPEGPKMKVAFILASDSPEFYGFAVNKGNDRLLDLLNRGIMLVQDKGIDGDLRRKWIGF